MYTFIEDNHLFVLFPDSGRIFLIRRSSDGQHIIVMLEEILHYGADVDKLILEKKAVMVEG